MTNVVRAIAVILALVVVVAAAGAWQLNRAMTRPLAVPDGGTTFVIDPGSSFRTVARNLVEQGLIERDFWLRVSARWSGAANSIHAGEYRIEPGTTPYRLLGLFEEGAVQLYAFTIIEGWNRYDLLNALRDSEIIDASLTDEDWPAFLAELRASVAKPVGIWDKMGLSDDNPEGLFLPETYNLPRGISDREFLKMAFMLMRSTLIHEWNQRSEDTAVKTHYEALILASIIEKETARTDERQRISGVFTRRLEKRMRLQTDPTVIYGIGPGFNGNITRKDLRTDTPYNTYTRHGLPPTPIAMPGQAAIHAALHPADGEELFFVATGLGDGSHAFSKTKDEHDAAVAEYLKRLRQNRREGR
ncbi:MAG: endolytic transglycosylase MltG [Woeseiaceae bacterium]|nr:endolytic transglycosylase MltG [Woeseiaceae bacterium]